MRAPIYRDIIPLYEQAHDRLAPTGRMYVLTSSEIDMPAVAVFFERARFRAQPVHQRSHLIESVFIHELRPE
jgi:release factor glutamine methyltransferase